MTRDEMAKQVIDNGFIDWRYPLTARAVVDLVGDLIAQEIEALPIDAYGSQEPRGPVSFARAEAFIRAARIARGGAK
jgi:hypothetical protein